MARKFPETAWSSYHFSIRVLSEFVKATLPAAGPASFDVIDSMPNFPAIPNDADIIKELKQLITLIDYRPQVAAEAIAQSNNILIYFQGVLSFSNTSHPLTYRLCHSALRVAQFVAMHKAKPIYRRARPSQLCPSLMPLIEVPGHASFPSGHATEAYMLAGMLTKVMPNGAAGPLDRMAERVARNREVMGLHYRSDTRAGQFIAEKALLLLETCPTVRNYVSPPAGQKGDKDEWA